MKICKRLFRCIAPCSKSQKAKKPKVSACQQVSSAHLIRSSSYSITNLGQGGLFRSQMSYRLVVSYVVVQVVVFLLDDNSEVVLGACCLIL
jgi:hypothetical protein